jgi:hypothetical protein
MMNWKEYGRKRSWANFMALRLHLAEGAEKNHEKTQSG